MISVRVDGRETHVTTLYAITSGSVGLPVKFRFSDDWADLTKTARFRNGDTTVDVTLTSNSCTVPATVLATPGKDLWIGVYGADSGGDIAIPTIWGKAGHVYDGVTPVGE